MTDKDKLEKIKKLADAMYYNAHSLATDASGLRKAMAEYHQFLINEYHNRKEEDINNGLDLGCGVIWKNEEPVSEDLQGAIDNYLATFFGSYKDQQMWPSLNKMAIYIANWQKEQIIKKAFPAEIGRQRSDYKCMLHGNFCRYNTGDKVKIVIIKESK